MPMKLNTEQIDTAILATLPARTITIGVAVKHLLSPNDKRPLDRQVEALLASLRRRGVVKPVRDGRSSFWHRA